MNNRFNIFIFIIFTYIFLVGTSANAANIIVSDVAYDPVTKLIMVYSNSVISPQIKRINNPERMIIDIPNSIWMNDQKLLNIQDNGIKKVRVSQYQANPPQVRIVYELLNPVDFDFKIETIDKKRYILKIAVQNQKKVPKPASKDTKPYKKAFLKTIEIKDNMVLLSTSEQMNMDIKREGKMSEYTVSLYNISIPSEGDLPVDGRLIKSLNIHNTPSGGLLKVNLEQSYGLLPALSDDNKTLYLKILKTKELVNSVLIKDIKIEETDKNSAVIKIMTESPFTFKIDSLTSPNRLVIDTVGTVLQKATPPQSLNGSIITAVRFGELEWLNESSHKGVRIVLDLTSPVGYEYNFSNDSNSLDIKLSNISSTVKLPDYTPPSSSSVSNNNGSGNTNSSPPPPVIQIYPDGPVILDPGHGGRDPGAVGVSGKYEKEVNSGVVYFLQRFLENNDYKVVLTRSTDSEVLLQPRVDIANQNKGLLLISIHANSIPNPAITGIETYYYSDPSLTLAQILHKNLITALNVPDRRIRKRELFMTKRPLIPSVLIEVGFLTNATEEQTLSNPAYQRKIAEALFAGIKEYHELIKSSVKNN